MLGFPFEGSYSNPIYKFVKIPNIAKIMWTPKQCICTHGQVEQVIQKHGHLFVAIAATTLVVSGFPADVETWLQGFAPIQTQEHQ